MLIETIKNEKAELIATKKLKRSQSHTERSRGKEEGEMPFGWEWVTVDELTSVGTGTTPPKSRLDYYQKGTTPWITSAATNEDFIEKPSRYVTKLAVEERRMRLYPAGSLVVALYGQGKTRGQVGQLMFDSTSNQANAVIEFFGTGLECRDYFRLVFKKKYDELRKLAAGGAQPNLSGGMIRLTKIPLPPLAEQKRIVAKVDQLMALCDDLETKLTQAHEDAESLAASLVFHLCDATGAVEVSA